MNRRLFLTSTTLAAALEKLCKHLGLYKADVNLLPVVPFFKIIYPDGYKPPIDAEPVEAVPVRAVEHEGEVAYTPLPPLPEDG